MRVVILGAGRIGFFLGGCLLNGGFSLHFVGRQRIFKELEEEGGFYCSDIYNNKIFNPINTFTYSEEYSAKEGDVVIITVKNLALEEVAADLKEKLKNIKENTVTLISLLNGVTHYDVLSTIKGQTVLFGVFGPNVTIEKNADYHLATLIPILLPSTPLTLSFHSSLLRCPVKIQMKLVKDIKAIAYGKLLTNMHNPLSALTFLTLVEEMGSLEMRLLFAAIIDEGLKVFKAHNIAAKGVTLMLSPKVISTVLRTPNWLYFLLAKKSLQMDKNARSSMYDDLSAHRPTEIDYLNGVIVTLAQQVNLPVPINAKIVELVKQAEKQNFTPYTPSQLTKLVNPTAPSPFAFLVMFHAKLAGVIAVLLLILYYLL